MKKSLIVKIVSGVVLAVVIITGVVIAATAPAAGIPVAAGSGTYDAGADSESLAAGDAEDEADDADGENRVSRKNRWRFFTASI